MASIDVQVKGLDQALKRLRPAVAREAASRGLRKAGINAATQAKRNASGRPGPNVDRGHLRASITAGDVEGAGTSLSIAIGASVKYARIHELGGVIEPKTPGGWLKFRTKDGAFHTVKSVTIPARPYLAPAVNSPFAQRAIYTFITDELDRALGAR